MLLYVHAISTPTHIPVQVSPHTLGLELYSLVTIEYGFSESTITAVVAGPGKKYLI